LPARRGEGVREAFSQSIAVVRDGVAHVERGANLPVFFINDAQVARQRAGNVVGNGDVHARSISRRALH
jgi:hypothetical protein